MPSGSGCGTPASVSLVGERALYTASYLSFCICLVLCSVSRPGCLLDLSQEISLFFFFVHLEILRFGLLSHLSSLRLSSGHSGPVLTLSTDYAAHVPVFSPCSLVVDGSLCWQLQLGTCSVGFFSSRLCCPLRFQNSPQALL